VILKVQNIMRLLNYVMFWQILRLVLQVNRNISQVDVLKFALMLDILKILLIKPVLLMLLVALLNLVM